ncbi:MAG TPA: TM1812 family CRISPR-associated protein, partial [Clostridia bacterium]|nr:TM1812 family CRISPR-associated protein [Clostridia bacterium]
EIYYGAFEAKDEENRAPIFNLSAFNQITDWTIASEKFLETGDSRALARILKSEINPILREKKDKDHYAKLVNKVSDKLVCFSSALYTVRGKDIIRYGKQLKEALEAIKDEKNEIMSLVPFNKILNMIYEKVAFYSGDIVLDIHNTVKLCKEFNLVQQAYTLLRENLVTYACVKAGFDVYDKKAREDTAKAISAKEYFDKKVIEIYSDISYIRNDINHGGYRDSSMGADKFREKLDEMINRFEMIINE